MNTQHPNSPRDKILKAIVTPIAVPVPYINREKLADVIKALRETESTAKNVSLMLRQSANYPFSLLIRPAHIDAYDNAVVENFVSFPGDFAHKVVLDDIVTGIPFNHAHELQSIYCVGLTLEQLQIADVTPWLEEIGVEESKLPSARAALLDAFATPYLTYQRGDCFVDDHVNLYEMIDVLQHLHDHQEIKLFIPLETVSLIFWQF